MLYQPWGCYKRRSFFVYTMSQVQICACTRIYIWRMYIIELVSEMLYGVYRSSRSQPARLYDEPSAEVVQSIQSGQEHPTRSYYEG